MLIHVSRSLKHKHPPGQAVRVIQSLKLTACRLAWKQTRDPDFNRGRSLKLTSRQDLPVDPTATSSVGATDNLNLSTTSAMLPKNLISFVALHAPIIIHATLAMTLSHQVIEGSEDIKSMETAPITGEVDFGDEFDEVKCRQNKETIGSMKKDMTVIREHISWLETVHESIFWDVQNKLKQMDLHLTKHIRAKIIQLDGKHPEAEPIAFWGVVGKKENNLLGIEHTHADLQEDHFQSREIKTLGTQAHKEEWLSTKKEKINNWEIDAEKYDNIKNIFVSIKCLFLFANFIKRYQLIQPSFMAKIHTFEPNTIFKMAMLNLELKSKLPRNASFRRKCPWWAFRILTKNPVEIHFQPYINALPRSQQKIISYLSLKEYIKTFEADCQTGLENFSFILEESSHNGSLGRLDNLSSEISSGISTRQQYRELELCNKIKNCFESFDKNHPITNETSFLVTGRFTINYYFIDFIKNFYKNVFDELKPVDNKGNSLVFQAKMKLVEDYLIYTQDKVGNQNLMHLKEHHDNLFMENNPGSATYFDWSSPFVSSLLKL
ncbi:hypothetical protein Pst134EA_015191 [Puccinia striiformis f. sp. tritici]|uniref:hypothetical protein n=1 Tax=Puccinia striiformis f. sp. tritici TaxID=168172 RepID=UPI002007B68D|nr:hypothetical protein Pst134EA_015191 [Puccinia striiformis f. sp. tritici]KAH9463108.1 hypothetical protein Pst134EA_015191 [Puccinia striiformis f. sp. tritici]